MPDWKPEILRRLASLNLAPAREAEIAEELSQHLDDRYQELISRGLTEDAAFRVALDELKGEDLLVRSLKSVEKDFHREPIALGATSNTFSPASSRTFVMPSVSCAKRRSLRRSRFCRLRWA